MAWTRERGKSGKDCVAMGGHVWGRRHYEIDLNTTTYRCTRPGCSRILAVNHDKG